METKANEVKVSVLLIGAYEMNRIISDVESDANKVKLVDLWTQAHALKRELDTLRHLINALPTNEQLPY